MGGSAGGDGDWVGEGVLRNRCFRVNAAIPRSVKFPAHTAFAEGRRLRRRWCGCGWSGGRGGGSGG